ncbi:MAG: MFS transporter [Planctomycetaceae bacterium]
MPSESENNSVVVDEPKLQSRNFIALACHQILFRIAWIFKTETVIMPAFVDSIAGPGWVRGFLPVLNRLSQSVVPAMLAARLTHQPWKKQWLIAATILMGLPFVALSAIWIFYHETKPAWLAVVFLILYSIFFGVSGLNVLVFGVLQGKLLKAQVRGRLLGISGFLGSAGAVVCAWWLLPGWMDRPDGGFSLIFGFTGLGFIVSGLCGLFVVEPADETHHSTTSGMGQLNEVWSIIREHAEFRRLIYVSMLVMTVQLLFPHYQALAREKLGATHSVMWFWVVAQNAAVGLFSWFAGKVADRRGNRLAIIYQTFCAAFTPLLAVVLSQLSPQTGLRYYWLVFCMLGFTPVTLKTLTNYTLELTPQDRHPRFLSTLHLSLAVPFLASPLVGYIVDLVGFEPVFIATSVLIALGCLLALRLPEPRYR